MGRLEGKVAFLTGAGAGIAKATALAYVREGAKVAIIELNKEAGTTAEKDVRAAGGDAIFIETDVTKEDSVKRAVEATVAKRRQRGGRNVEAGPILEVGEGAKRGRVPVHELLEREDTPVEPAGLVVLLNAKEGGGERVLGWKRQEVDAGPQRPTHDRPDPRRLHGDYFASPSARNRS